MKQYLNLSRTMNIYSIFIAFLIIINLTNLEAKPHLVNHFMNTYNEEFINDSVTEDSPKFNEKDRESEEKNWDDISWKDFPKGKFNKTENPFSPYGCEKLTIFFLNYEYMYLQCHIRSFPI